MIPILYHLFLRYGMDDVLIQTFTTATEAEAWADLHPPGESGVSEVDPALRHALVVVASDIGLPPCCYAILKTDPDGKPDQHWTLTHDWNP